jgi:flagellar biosynthesis/type III secretory pathway protein FliH
MEQALTEIDQIKEDLAVAAERDLLEFAVAMAARLTFAIGALHRESAMQNLRRALLLVGSKSDLTVRVHPDDLASMETFAESVVKKMGTARAVNLVPDTTVAPGGCTVGAAEIEVDASLETQIDEMVSLLLGKKNV